MSTAKRKKRFPLGRLVLVLLLLPALYLAFQLYHVTRDTYEYETAICYTMADSLTADGIVLFEETPVEGSGTLGYLVENGERVSAGTSVAEVYTDASQANVRRQLDILNRQLALLQKSQNTASTQMDVLIAQRSTAVYDLLEEIDRNDTASLPETGENFLLAQNKLQITTGEADGFSQQISDLTSQRDDMAAQLATLQTVSAPISGYFVDAEDTALLTMAPADIKALSASQLSDLLQSGATQAMENAAGKVVPSYTWQFCGVCTLEEAAKFSGVKTVNISFPGKAETKLPAEVLSVEPEEGSNLVKFTLQCKYMNAEILKLTQEKAEIDFKSYDGLRVSAQAVHMVAPDEADSIVATPAPESTASQAESIPASSAPSSTASSSASSGAAQSGDYVTGVYVKYGNLARFRRIQVLYQAPGGDYLLAAPGGALNSENELRLYDEIIVSGTNLYDGKLL